MLVASDLEATRDVFSGHTHRRIKCRLLFDETRVERHLRSGHRNHRHRLDATGDTEVNLSDGNAIRNDGRSLDTRRAEAVDGHRRNFDGKTRANRDKSSHVHALLSLGECTAENDVFDLSGGHPRARQRGTDHSNSQVVGTRVFERTLYTTTERSTSTLQNDDFTHGGSVSQSAAADKHSLSSCDSKVRRNKHLASERTADEARF